MIQTFNIKTSMGTCLDELPFLTDEELNEFNCIGYSGKTTDGKKIGKQAYLNSLGKGEFQVTQTKYDDGNFEERFTIVWVN